MSTTQDHGGQGDNVAGNKIIQISIPKMLSIGGLFLIGTIIVTQLYPLLGNKTPSDISKKQQELTTPATVDTSILPVQKKTSQKFADEKAERNTKSETSTQKEEEKKVKPIEKSKPSIQEPAKTESTSNSSQSTPTSKNYFEAKGKCIINREKFSNEYQAVLMAETCAKTVAQAELLDQIKGLDIYKEFGVKNMDVAQDLLIETKIGGNLKRSYQAGEAKVGKGIVEVTVRVNKSDLKEVLFE